MPEICRFFGIIIAMFYNEHAPPHFHVRYSGQKAIIGIDALTILEGKLSPRVHGLVIEWASQHQDELRENWRLARVEADLHKIEPLE